MLSKSALHNAINGVELTIDVYKRQHFVYFTIIYTCICVTVMAFTVFFQYRAYTKNYNVTVAKLCALIHEKYPDVSDLSLIHI